jgi:antitoxin YefM
MEHVSYSELRQNLARYLDEAVDSRAPILVARQGGKGNVVLLSAEEFASLEETLHLLGNPANARRLLYSIKAAEAGDVVAHPLVADHDADPVV